MDDTIKGIIISVVLGLIILIVIVKGMADADFNARSLQACGDHGGVSIRYISGEVRMARCYLPDGAHVTIHECERGSRRLCLDDAEVDLLKKEAGKDDAD